MNSDSISYLCYEQDAQHNCDYGDASAVAVNNFFLLAAECLKWVWKKHSPGGVSEKHENI